MDKYKIEMLSRASRDLDNIYNHIADYFKEIGTAEKWQIHWKLPSLVLMKCHTGELSDEQKPL